MVPQILVGILVSFGLGGIYLDLKKFLGGKIMKKVYEGRIVGFGLILFVIGGLGFAKFGPDMFLSLIPKAMIWFMNYEFNSYEAKYGHDRGEED